MKVIEWDVSDGDVLGAIVECPECPCRSGTGCDGTGRLHRPYRLPGGHHIDLYRDADLLVGRARPLGNGCSETARRPRQERQHCGRCGMSGTAIPANHDIRVTSSLNDIIVTCATCEDEIGSSFASMRLEEINRCVDLHVRGPMTKYRRCRRCDGTDFLSSAWNSDDEPVWICRDCLGALTGNGRSTDV